MPPGNGCVSFPFGPCTSTAPSCTLTVTPFGTTMGFFPIRDIFLILVSLVLGPSPRAGVLSKGRLRSKAQKLRPKRSQNIPNPSPADARFHGIAAGHPATRGGQNARTEPRQHLRHIVAPE